MIKKIHDIRNEVADDFAFANYAVYSYYTTSKNNFEICVINDSTKQKLKSLCKQRIMKLVHTVYSLQKSPVIV